MDKREALNEELFHFREIREDEIPDDEWEQLKGMERVAKWKPHPYRYALPPAIIVTGFALYILFLAKLWWWMLLAPVPGVIFFLLLFWNSPTVCPKCKQEMNYFRPLKSGSHKGYITYDWCKSCRTYCNVRWSGLPQENTM